MLKIAFYPPVKLYSQPALFSTDKLFVSGQFVRRRFANRLTIQQDKCNIIEFIDLCCGY